ncbi:hypothetical protein MalM25_02440 [Planctomycetes bacterium MalM25]|nr:hypothetical protein MalM25_02440 [Planctomycetes bacterium MalM25]
MNAENAYASHDTQAVDRSWLVLLHLSLFLGHLVPFAGYVGPIMIWQLMKDGMPEMDAHGRNVANWIVASTFYHLLFGILCVALVGIPFLVLTVVLSIVFPIIGAVKASQGVVWRYPLTVRFF